MSEFDSKEQKRSFPREVIRVRAGIRVAGHWLDCAIVNISPKGARLQVDGQISRGMEVLVKIGDFGTYKANVAWRQGNEVGVAFNHDPAEMTGLMMGLASYS